MARILHVVHAETIKHVRVIVDDLEAVLEGGWLSLDIATSNQEYLVTGRLNVGEVVLEGRLHVDGSAEHLLFLHVVLVDVFGVALEHVY